jgi:hypothetical protein
MIGLSKKQLRYLYITKKLSAPVIARLYGCSSCYIYNLLTKFSITIRNASKAMKVLFKNPKHHPSYKDGRSVKPHYCIKCKRKIHWKNQSGLCKHCVMNKNWKSALYRERRLTALHTHHIDGNGLNDNKTNKDRLTPNEHRKVHKSLLQIVWNLVRNHYIVYDRIKKIYKVKDLT